MFERKLDPSSGVNKPVQIRQLSRLGEPVEFVYNGVRFHVNQSLTRWLQTNNWWQRLDKDLETDELSEQVIKFWQVEAAPIGAITTFEIEFNQSNNTWQIRPSSRANSRDKN